MTDKNRKQIADIVRRACGQAAKRQTICCKIRPKQNIKPMNKAPKFWNKKTFISSLLLPLSWSCARGRTAGMDHLDKIIVAGYLCWQYQRWRDWQTPFTAYLCQHLRSEGFRPAILTRGYGGSLKGAIIADPTIHSAADVGDEA